VNRVNRFHPLGIAALGLALTLALPPIASAAPRPSPTPFDFPPIGVGSLPGAQQSPPPAPEPAATTPQNVLTPETAAPAAPALAPKPKGLPPGAAALHPVSASAPIPQLAQLRWMLGTWTAHRRASLSLHSKPADESIYVFALTMGGRWMFGSDGKGRDLLYLSYDAANETWALVRIGGRPSYEVLLSKGWRNGRLTFVSTEDVIGTPLTRTSFVHLIAGQFALFEEEERPDSSWAPLSEVDFTKSK
jgi:hypothetical protein